KPGNILVGAQNGNDKRGLWSFNYTTQEFDELVYQRNDVDIWGVRRDSNDWQNPDKIVAVSYFKDRFHYEYFDEVEGALYDQLESVIPWAHQVSVSSRSRDGNTLVISNSGPRDPGTYYLIHQGKVETIGSRQPLIDSEKLADVKYIQYKSRDGVMIPGFVHVPKGEGPHPLVVMPHGGPFVSEVVIYDEWAQMLANNGYMVLQPQYRGSQNYGLGFYKTAFIDGGTGGHMMQDDKDDGALYLVEKGMADPDRIAMFGWSYGGYAALIAASRSPQIYQCVIAGAAVTDNNLQVNYYRFRLRGAQKLEQLGFWDDSISPIEEVDKVNVPMLMIHGSVDQRVPPEHAKRYLEALADGNKNHKYMWLEGADHFSNTLFYDHKIKLYNAMIDYLQNDCGPGGLQAATVN
ncbi:MAG: prolyl oligopeptidase family serine peptidase, partial [Pseudomonadota bacterium]